MIAAWLAAALITEAYGAAPASAAPAAPIRDPAASARVSGQHRPNIILFLTDDMRADDVQYMPSVRRLIGQHGVTFVNALSPDPLCCPSRASLLSGKFAHNTHVIGNSSRDAGGFKRFRHFVDQGNLLPSWLQRAGYRTWHIGKHLNGFKSRVRQPGWDYWNATIDGEYDYRNWAVAEQGRVRRHRDSYQETVVRHTLLSAIDRWAPSPQPFFAWVGHLAPHGSEQAKPPEPDSRFAGAYRGHHFGLPPSFGEADISDKPHWVRLEPSHLSPPRAQLSYEYRVETLLSVDQTVQATVERLRKLHEYRRTVLIFTSDNGFNIGEHRHHGKNVSYEESLRVPLLIAGPGGFPPGTVVRGPVSLVDIPRTIADIAGAHPGLKQDGISLAHAASAKTVRANRVIPIEGGRWDFPRWRRQPTDALGHFYWGARWSHYIYVQYATGEREFYDLAKDPFELSNSYRHSAPSSSVQARLARWVSAHKNCAAADCRAPLTQGR
jgi:arylsulfatase A-like enzyme